MTADGWWRRNRWGLVALPVTLAVALAASSYRVEDQWWLDRPRQLVGAAQGEWVDFDDTQYDRTGDVPFSVRVRLTGLHPADVPVGDGELDVPDGVRAIAVDLELAAAPDVPLTGCQLSVRDSEGTSYSYQSSSPSISQPASPCVPPDAQGPDLDLFEGLDADTGPRRPDEWQVSPVVLVPDGVEITEVVLSWGAPRGIRFSAS